VLKVASWAVVAGLFVGCAKRETDSASRQPEPGAAAAPAASGPVAEPAAPEPAVTEPVAAEPVAREPVKEPAPVPEMPSLDWPQYLGPDRDGRSEAAGLARTWPAGGPEVLWTVKLGAGYAAACVSAGEVFVLDRVGGKDDTKDVLRCFGLEDGKERWTFEYDAPGKFSHNGSRSTPAADAQRVYIVGPLGHFHCLDRKTHGVLWKKNLLADYGGGKPKWAVAQSPLLYKDMVIVAPQKRAGIVAFDKVTGETVWETPALQGMSYASPMLMTIEGVDQVVVLSNKGTVTGADASTGDVLWTYDGWECRIPITCPVALGDGRVFVTGGYGAGSAMFRVEKQGGVFSATELFKTDEVGAQMHLPLVRGGHMYVNSNDNSRSDGLTCIDFDGNVKWKTRRSPNFERGSLLLADDLIYMMDGKSAELYLLEATPEKYTELARAKVLSGSPKESWAPMALADGKLIVRNQHEMKCLDVRAR
jgi:outer membrane protein assembly factor BamB